MKPPETGNNLKPPTTPKITITSSSTLDDLINKYSQLDPTLVSDVYHSDGHKDPTTTDFLLKEFVLEAPAQPSKNVEIGNDHEEEQEMVVVRTESTKSQSNESPLTLSKTVSGGGQDPESMNISH